MTPRVERRLAVPSPRFSALPLGLQLRVKPCALPRPMVPASWNFLLPGELRDAMGVWAEVLFERLCSRNQDNDYYLIGFFFNLAKINR